MTERLTDPTLAPFWEGAAAHELRVQHCRTCGHHQFYPRPFCLACDGEELEWTSVAGTATVYSVTTVHIQVLPQLVPPYDVALVELDEGPRLLTRLTAPAAIGARVRVTWEERPDAPPLPVFGPVADAP